MAGGVNPFGFSMGVLPAPRAPRQPQDLPSAPFGFAPPPSKMQQTLGILNEYNPLPAFERLLKSPMALGGTISEQDIADGLMVSGSVMGGSAAAPKPRNALNMGIRAYHGSPHDFDRFDMSKIGTGEGAQAYGHGLYFADSEGVAKSYRDQLSKQAFDVKKIADPYLALSDEDAVRKIGYAIKQAEVNGQKGIAADYKAAQDWFKAGRPDQFSAGHMYEVNINADPDSFLDWDKPLSEQPEAIRQALTGKLGFKPAGWPYDGYLSGRQSMLRPDAGGDEIYRAVGKERGDGINRLPSKEAATEILREAGIPGIKYLDAGSRGAGDGTRNYVVFDDRLIEVVRKYGIAGASAMLGYNILDGMDPAQAEELKRIEGNQ